MKQCPLCGRTKSQRQFQGYYCGFCDKIAADCHADRYQDFQQESSSGDTL